MKKDLYITVTVIIMLIISIFSAWIVDATVQIDDDLELLIILLVIVNTVIGVISYMVYRNNKG